MEDWRDIGWELAERYDDDIGRYKAIVQTAQELHRLENWVEDAEARLATLRRLQDKYRRRWRLLTFEEVTGQQLCVEDEESADVDRLAKQLEVMKCTG